MSWSKLKQQLDSFLSPTLAGTVAYRATSYRFLPDKSGSCYLTVDQKNILNMADTTTTPIRWYQTDQEIKNDPGIVIPVSPEEIEAIRKETKGAVPEERLEIMVRGRKSTSHAKELLAAQAALSKANFTAVATTFLATSIEDNLESSDILLNILALIDRRVGKKRILNMSDSIKMKHSAVQYFYELRRRTV
ncbi:hypothetical protein EC604_14690 [Paenibacillus amylolyticus]|uniref:Uncharacterized protein n=1 Tax=Paenibacillus amylolyticus TaxID=1451 RepID=A0A5M9WUF6_PAEAM|nr:hypothetical protein [Paenibacillus amylolyticus]KAA8785089.1 hypothetical protein EC604_14690 [Paenibacillus amylolyticus]